MSNMMSSWLSFWRLISFGNNNFEINSNNNNDNVHFHARVQDPRQAGVQAIPEDTAAACTMAPPTIVQANAGHDDISIMRPSQNNSKRMDSFYLRTLPSASSCHDSSIDRDDIWGKCEGYTDYIELHGDDDDDGDDDNGNLFCTSIMCHLKRLIDDDGHIGNFIGTNNNAGSNDNGHINGADDNDDGLSIDNNDGLSIDNDDGLSIDNDDYDDSDDSLSYHDDLSDDDDDIADNSLAAAKQVFMDWVKSMETNRLALYALQRLADPTVNPVVALDYIPRHVLGILFETGGNVRPVKFGPVFPSLQAFERMVTFEDRYATCNKFVHEAMPYLLGSAMDVLCTDPSAAMYVDLRLDVQNTLMKRPHHWHKIHRDCPQSGYVGLLNNCFRGTGIAAFSLNSDVQVLMSNSSRSQTQASLKPNPNLPGVYGPVLVYASTFEEIQNLHTCVEVCLDMPNDWQAFLPCIQQTVARGIKECCL
jgi:hypothetical protein